MSISRNKPKLRHLPLHSMIVLPVARTGQKLFTNVDIFVYVNLVLMKKRSRKIKNVQFATENQQYFKKFTSVDFYNFKKKIKKLKNEHKPLLSL